MFFLILQTTKNLISISLAEITKNMYLVRVKIVSELLAEWCRLRIAPPCFFSWVSYVVEQGIT